MGYSRDMGIVYTGDDHGVHLDGQSGGFEQGNGLQLPVDKKAGSLPALQKGTFLADMAGDFLADPGIDGIDRDGCKTNAELAQVVDVRANVRAI